ncbi:hypothetical protein IEQ34_006932 [Dendrobium chrysotoxum]|uniref:Uncharacterized protein n=1 Tax=Dendrobium chrysotoxum TaxID=161865 RepID=A0AAV7H505_DENCH|nr:hypothetical protein IEQ34_006932 [Dendrobium chrysotoxum]
MHPTKEEVPFPALFIAEALKSFRNGLQRFLCTRPLYSYLGEPSRKAADVPCPHLPQCSSALALRMADEEFGTRILGAGVREEEARNGFILT